jgi:hypothetical protein
MRIALLALALAGCATPPPPDTGPPPANHEALFAAWLGASLKDPGSAIVNRVAGPARYVKPGSLLTIPVTGWASCYTVNARNSFGGYAGARLYVPIYINGSLWHVDYAEDKNPIKAAELMNYCRSVR